MKQFIQNASREIYRSLIIAFIFTLGFLAFIVFMDTTNAYVTANHNQSITTNNPAENVGYTCVIINTTYPLVEVHKVSGGGGVRNCILNYVGNGDSIGATPHYKDCSTDDPVAYTTYVGDVAYYPNITLNKSSKYCFASDNYGNTYQQKLNSGIAGAPIPDTWVTWIGGGFYTSGATAYFDPTMFIEIQSLVFNNPPTIPPFLNLSTDIVDNTIIHTDSFTYTLFGNTSDTEDFNCTVYLNGNNSGENFLNFTNGVSYTYIVDVSGFNGVVTINTICYDSSVTNSVSNYIVRISPVAVNVTDGMRIASAIDIVSYILLFIATWIAFLINGIKFRIPIITFVCFVFFLILGILITSIQILCILSSVIAFLFWIKQIRDSKKNRTYSAM